MAESAGQALPEYLEESLNVLERETPIHLTAMTRHLGRLAAVVRVAGSPPFRVCLAAAPRIGPGVEADIDIRLSPSEIDLFLSGALTLEEALESDRLKVVAKDEHFLAFRDALEAWLHGALRAPSMPALNDRFIASRLS